MSVVPQLSVVVSLRNCLCCVSRRTRVLLVLLLGTVSLACFACCSESVLKKDSEASVFPSVGRSVGRFVGRRAQCWPSSTHQQRGNGLLCVGNRGAREKRRLQLSQFFTGVCGGRDLKQQCAVSNAHEMHQQTQHKRAPVSPVAVLLAPSLPVCLLATPLVKLSDISVSNSYVLPKSFLTRLCQDFAYDTKNFTPRHYSRRVSASLTPTAADCGHRNTTDSRGASSFFFTWNFTGPGVPPVSNEEPIAASDTWRSNATYHVHAQADSNCFLRSTPSSLSSEVDRKVWNQTTDTAQNLLTDHLTQICRRVNLWYSDNGFVRCFVDPSQPLQVCLFVSPQNELNARVSFSVTEGRVASPPLTLTAVRSATDLFQENPVGKKLRTNQQRISQELGLRPGDVFRIDSARWRHVFQRSGLFVSSSYHIVPRSNNTAQLCIRVVEAPARLFSPSFNILPSLCDPVFVKGFSNVSPVQRLLRRVFSPLLLLRGGRQRCGREAWPLCKQQPAGGSYPRKSSLADSLVFEWTAQDRNVLGRSIEASASGKCRYPVYNSEKRVDINLLSDKLASTRPIDDTMLPRNAKLLHLFAESSPTGNRPSTSTWLPSKIGVSLHTNTQLSPRSAATHVTSYALASPSQPDSSSSSRNRSTSLPTVGSRRRHKTSEEAAAAIVESSGSPSDNQFAAVTQEKRPPSSPHSSWSHTPPLVSARLQVAQHSVSYRLSSPQPQSDGTSPLMTKLSRLALNCAAVVNAVRRYQQRLSRDTTTTTRTTRTTTRTTSIAGKQSREIQDVLLDALNYCARMDAETYDGNYEKTRKKQRQSLKPHFSVWLDGATGSVRDLSTSAHSWFASGRIAYKVRIPFLRGCGETASDAVNSLTDHDLGERKSEAHTAQRSPSLTLVGQLGHVLQHCSFFPPKSIGTPSQSLGSEEQSSSTQRNQDIFSFTDNVSQGMAADLDDFRDTDWTRSSEKLEGQYGPVACGGVRYSSDGFERLDTFARLFCCVTTPLVSRRFCRLRFGASSAAKTPLDPRKEMIETAKKDDRINHGTPGRVWRLIANRLLRYDLTFFADSIIGRGASSDCHYLRTSFTSLEEKREENQLQRHNKYCSSDCADGNKWNRWRYLLCAGVGLRVYPVCHLQLAVPILHWAIDAHKRRRPALPCRLHVMWLWAL